MVSVAGEETNVKPLSLAEQLYSYLESSLPAGSMLPTASLISSVVARSDYRRGSAGGALAGRCICLRNLLSMAETTSHGMRGEERLCVLPPNRNSSTEERTAKR